MRTSVSALVFFPLTLTVSIFLAITAVITVTIATTILFIGACITLTNHLFFPLSAYLSTLLSSLLYASSTPSDQTSTHSSSGFISLVRSRSHPHLLHTYYPHAHAHARQNHHHHHPSPHRRDSHTHRNRRHSDTPLDSADHAIPGIPGVIRSQLPPNTYESSRRHILDSNNDRNIESGEWTDTPPTCQRLGRRCLSPVRVPSTLDVHQYDSDKGGLLPLGPQMETPAQSRRRRSSAREKRRNKSVENSGRW